MLVGAQVSGLTSRQMGMANYRDVAERLSFGNLLV